MLVAVTSQPQILDHTCLQPRREAGSATRAMEDLPESTNTTSLQQESRAVLQGLARPAHGERSEDVSVGYDQDVAVDLILLGAANDGLVVFLADVGDKSVETGRDLIRAPLLLVSVQLISAMPSCSRLNAEAR